MSLEWNCESHYVCFARFLWKWILKSQWEILARQDGSRIQPAIHNWQFGQMKQLICSLECTLIHKLASSIWHSVPHVHVVALKSGGLYGFAMFVCEAYVFWWLVLVSILSVLSLLLQLSLPRFWLVSHPISFEVSGVQSHVACPYSMDGLYHRTLFIC